MTKNYDHLALDVAIVADGMDTGNRMADRIIADFTLKLLNPDVTREITAMVVEDVETRCIKARAAGVPDDIVAEWRGWYEVGYSTRVEKAFGKQIADHAFSRHVAGTTLN
jgi:hypothetical protein